MTSREQLLQELEQAPDELVQTVLDFLHRVQAVRKTHPLAKFAGILSDDEAKELQHSIDLVAVEESQNRLNDLLKQLSPERLQVLADFASYLANAESETATQELLAIPGLLERIKQNQATPKAQYANWRTLRSDV